MEGCDDGETVSKVSDCRYLFRYEEARVENLFVWCDGGTEYGRIWFAVGVGRWKRRIGQGDWGYRFKYYCVYAEPRQ